MKTKTINLYEYSELTAEAKQKALDNWRETNDDPLFQSHMINLLKEELEDIGLKYDTDSIDVLYSLGHCQGDGFMFMGTFTYKGKSIVVTHSGGGYYHSLTARFDSEELSDEDVSKFKTGYADICKKMEDTGYNEIEHANSEEVFEEVCEANGYTFRASGVMENE